MKPLISIAICSFRRYRYLESILEALDKQTLRPEEMELLFIDSAPVSDEMRRLFAAKATGSFARSSYERIERAGLSIARNRAIELASSGILAFLDDDALPCERWAESILEAFMDVRPRPAVVGGSASPKYELDPGKTDYGEKERLLLFSTVDFGSRSRWFGIGEGPIGANIAYDLQFLREASLRFNESLGRIGGRLIGGEEGDLLRRIREMRRSAYYAESARIEHIVEARRVDPKYIAERMRWTGRTHVMRWQAENAAKLAERWRYLLQAYQNYRRLHKGYRDTASKSRQAWQAYAKGMLTQAAENLVRDRHTRLIRKGWERKIGIRQSCRAREALRVLVSVRLSPVGYSGGRYHAHMIAIALAQRGHRVTVLRTACPEFEKDLSMLDGFEKVRFVQDSGFEAVPEEGFDVILIVPHFKEPTDIYQRLIDKARREGSALGYLNFETPNWVNQHMPGHRDPALWGDVHALQQHFDFVLANSRESMDYAKSFFDKVKADCRFSFAYPCINTAALARAANGCREKNRFVYICRFSSTDGHKGQDDLIKLVGPELAGCELDVVVGNGKPGRDWLEQFERETRNCRVKARLLYKISDVEKFELLKKARCLIFLSRFEGFGYPPIEALNAGSLVLAYDIPVVREVCGDFVEYVDCGDTNAARLKLRQMKDGTIGRLWNREEVKRIASVETFGRRLEEVIAHG